MNLTKNDFQSITLTHIINPHMFWFRPDTSYCNNEKYLALEESLFNHFQRTKVLVNNRKQFGVGEMAAVFMETWGKWIRVVVDRNIQMMHGKTKCILWAIDWGFPLQTDVERLLPLPVDCARIEPPNLYFAGLNYVLPSETTFDFQLMKSVEVQSKNWSELVVKEFRKLIDQASNIKFVAEFETERQHVFGRLEITTHNGIMIDAKDVLLHISGVMQMEDSRTFLTGLRSCNTTNIKRSNNNLNRLSFSDLNYNSLTSNALDTEYKINNDFFKEQNPIDIAMSLPSRNIVDKVEEWDRRNCDANSAIGLSDCSSDVGTLIIEDDAFDSISCYDPLNNCEQDFSIPEQVVAMQYYDDDDDECFVKRCDLIRQEIQKKYQYKMPRNPEIAFELPQKEESLETNAYLKQIKEKRKKIMDQMSVSSVVDHSNESDTVSHEPSTTSSYLEKIKEKRARALKAVETKNTTYQDTPQFPNPIQQEKTIMRVTDEPQYGKEEQQRRDKLLQSRKGTDRAIGLYPADYPVNKITQEIIDSRKSPQKNQYQKRQNGKQVNHKISPQQRLDKYNGSNFKPNSNSVLDNRSEVDSDVW